MASASFEPLPPAEIRRSSGGIPQSTYDVPSTSSTRRRSPSPGPSPRRYAPYDSYVPRAGPLYRDEFQNSYRPNVWRPGRSYYSRSPSPDRYEGSRVSDPDPWARPSHWQSSSWTDRRTHSPPPASWDRGRREIMAERMFEPSEAWKQHHSDRPSRHDFSDSSPVDRYQDHRMRPSRDLSPRAASRYDYPHHQMSDSYRPYSGGHPSRDSYPVTRSDTYRPSYEDNGSWRSTYSRDSPPSKAFQKRDVSPNNYSHRMSSTYHDHGIVRPHSPVRSSGIPSPRRLSNSFPSRVSAMEAPKKPIPLSDRQQHFTPPRPRSRGSSFSDEPPFKKFKSRSSSRCSDISHTVKSDISARSKFDVARQLQPPQINLITSQSSSHLSKDGDRRSPPRSHELSNALNGVESSTADEHRNLTGREEESSASPRTSSLPTPPQDVFPHQAIVLPSEITFGDKLLDSAKFDNVFDDQCKLQEDVTQSTGEEQHSEKPRVLSPVPLETAAVDVGSKSPDSKDVQDHDYTSVLTPSDTPQEPNPPPIDAIPEFLAAHDVPPSCDIQASTGHVSAVLNREFCETHESRFTAIADQLEETSRDASVVLSDGRKLPAVNSTAEALRVVVMTRLRCDRQTREERVLPVLRANLALIQHPPSDTSTSPEALIHEVVDSRHTQIVDMHTTIRPLLLQRFKNRQSSIADKAQKLREEYMVLHERWLAHCARLDNAHNKNGSLEESVVASGRSTRRSAAILGDAVRSDLEMEQIIASLGVEELTDPNHLAIKNVAKIPDMISVTNGSVSCLYDDTNNLVEEPMEYYNSQVGIEDWTDEEKAIFNTKFAAHPKQFGLVADHLPNKTAAQCITYYYLHKKARVDFRKVVTQYGPGKRRKGGKRTDKRKGNALLADIRQHDAEVSRDSSSAALNGGGSRRKKVLMRTGVAEEPKKPTARRNIIQSEQTPTSGTSTPDPEPNGQKKRRRAPASVRPAAVNGSVECDEGATDQSGERRATRKGRASRKGKVQPATPFEEPAIGLEATKFIDQSDATTRRRSAAGTVHWSDEDKSLFLALLAQHGDDFKRIAASMPNKTTIQVSNFYKSNVHELNLENVAAYAPKRSPTPEVSHDTWKDGAYYPGSGIMSPVAGAGTPVNSSSSSPPRRLQIRELLRATSADGRPSPLPWLENESTFSVQGPPLGNSTTVAVNSQSAESVHPHSPLLPRTHPPSNFTRFVTKSRSAMGHDMSHDASISSPQSLSFVQSLNPTTSYTRYPETSYPIQDMIRADRGEPMLDARVGVSSLLSQLRVEVEDGISDFSSSNDLRTPNNNAVRYTS